MGVRIALNSLPVTFRVKLVDCLTGSNLDITSVIDQFIVFYREDGTSFEKQAALVEDPPASSIFFLEYINIFPETAILDGVGKWEYQGKVEVANNDAAKTSQRFVLWVT